MPVRFKGVSEYRNKYRGPTARSRSASPHRRMLLAGLRSAHQGISREPQILSRRKTPTHAPQVSRSLQWDQLSELSRPDPAPPFRPAAGATGGKGGTAVAEIPETPATPRGPRPPEAPVPKEQSQSQPQPHSPLPSPTDQGPEPPINGVQHVLMRKAGLRAGRPSRGRQHSSEYQRQFEWKDRVANSPLLAAEQALHSSAVLPVHISNPVALESEYSRNFKGSPPPRPPRLRRDVERNQVPLFQRENVPPEKASKAKRKKRKEQHWERKHHNPKEEVGQCQPISTNQEAQQNVHSPRNRKMKSEYNANFRSPLQYQYKDGAWVKASDYADEGEGSAHNVAWYHEVRELKEKAELYRQRAWGTHFSRLHFNQILSDQNHLWEASTASASGSAEQSNRSRTDSSPTIEALDLARVGSGTGSANSARSGGQASTRGQPLAPTVPIPVQPKQAWGAREEPGPVERTDDQAEDKDEEEEERENGEKRERGEDRARESEGSSSLREGGRLPTPKLRTLGLAQRTHHDRTTPAAGGAILVSPPRARASMRERPSPSPQGKPRSPQRLMGHVSPAPTPGKAEEARLTRTPPAAGLTTVDHLPLRDDAWYGAGLSKEPPKRSSVPRSCRRRDPNVKAWTAPWATLPANRIQGALRDPEFQHNGNLGLHRPGLFVYPSSDTTLSDDDDRMSHISARSAASCSMADQVLGRALKRKENFWGKS
ncbi:nuclear protein MDM1 isoform X1 [Alosa sapidissima]|uniref:nuclear protein MDM1 isoform X1 n=1 Tax=Alosa sapidissima TaxID=34773 RepID=UPI001C08C1C9|nr:nuclear protein MDM1 isoform X1 [Alosa sapidissima]